MLNQRMSGLLVAAWLLLSNLGQAQYRATYEDDLRFLRRRTEVIELVQGDRRVAILPKWQGRVMTSTNKGQTGPSFGWINRPYIRSGERDEAFHNLGGEDRLWLAPETGPFALFQLPSEQKEWKTPPALNFGRFHKMPEHRFEGKPLVRLVKRLHVRNAVGTKFVLDVERVIRLLGLDDFASQFGTEAAARAKEADWVGFETRNTMRNMGRKMDASDGLVSIWILGQFPAGDKVVIMAPYKQGKKDELGEVAEVERYFGEVPENRLVVTENAVLLRGDGQFRSKVGISPSRVFPFAGSMDFQNKELTLIHFTLPEKPTEKKYVNNEWKLPQRNLFQGDVFNTYNHGPEENRVPMTHQFYELESLSPAAELDQYNTRKPALENEDAKITHIQATWHFTGDMEQLSALAKQTLGVDLHQVKKEMFDEEQ